MRQRNGKEGFGPSEEVHESGTIKKGRKTWKYSNHYKKLKAKHSELCRINAVNRQLAINEDVNHLRSLGGTYIEVPSNYRASQYDHTADDYIKKKLSDRLYKLRDGTEVQRDWYSSFLLYCYNYKTQNIDKKKCITEFEAHYNKEKSLIAWIKANKIKILNSGIKVA